VPNQVFGFARKRTRRTQFRNLTEEQGEAHWNSVVCLLVAANRGQMNPLGATWSLLLVFLLVLVPGLPADSWSNVKAESTVPPPTAAPTPTCMPTPVCGPCLHSICTPDNQCPTFCACEGPTFPPTCTPGPECVPPSRQVCDDSCPFAGCMGACRCVTDTTPTPTETPEVIIVRGHCGGDCDDDGHVTVDEILTVVNAALNGVSPETSRCTAGDINHDNHVTIDEILLSVDHALNGCLQYDLGG